MESYANLDKAETAGEEGISGVEGSEDNDSRIELVIELADTMDNEDERKPTTLAHIGRCAGSKGVSVGVAFHLRCENE